MSQLSHVDKYHRGQSRFKSWAGFEAVKGTKGGNEKPLSRLITNLQKNLVPSSFRDVLLSKFSNNKIRRVVIAKVVLRVHLNEVDDFKFVETKKVFAISRNSLLVQPTTVLKCLRVFLGCIWKVNEKNCKGFHSRETQNKREGGERKKEREREGNSLVSLLCESECGVRVHVRVGL